MSKPVKKPKKKIGKKRLDEIKVFLNKAKAKGLNPREATLAVQKKFRLDEDIVANHIGDVWDNG